MVIALVMVRAPKPPGSMQLISPPAAVLEIAPAKVLHGAVRLHGLTSSPTPDTQVRVAWAWAAEAQKNKTSSNDRLPNADRILRMEFVSPCTATTRVRGAGRQGNELPTQSPDAAIMFTTYYIQRRANQVRPQRALVGARRAGQARPVDRNGTPTQP